MKYFVLKPKGANEYAWASRIAMKIYADAISKHDPELSTSLYEWVDREYNFAKDIAENTAGKKQIVDSPANGNQHTQLAICAMKGGICHHRKYIDKPKYDDGPDNCPHKQQAGA